MYWELEMWFVVPVHFLLPHGTVVFVFVCVHYDKLLIPHCE